MTVTSFFDSATEAAGPRALNDLVRRVVLQETLACLAERGIPVMPLKGALLAYWVYDDPADRWVGDIDLLVPEPSFATAIDSLSARGYRPEPPISTRERSLRSQDNPMMVDLHRALFPRGRFRVTTKELFGRGRRDSMLFGAPVVLPDPRDVFAHLVGHSACDHTLPLDRRTGEDLERLARRFSLDARDCAEHLEATGFARAARYTLGSLGPEAGFAHRVLRFLRPDPLGEFLARSQRRANLSFPIESLPARISGHLTNTSLPLAAVSLFDAIAERFRYRKELLASK
jgi:hypothetical protein